MINICLIISHLHGPLDQGTTAFRALVFPGRLRIKMPLADELQAVAVQAQAATAKQGDTVRSLKASLKDGKVEKVQTIFLPH